MIGLLSGLGSLFNFGMGIAETGYKHLQNKKALQMEKEKMNFAREQFNWQKQQADITREREDNAIQRRSADLKKAGFNPYLTENMGAGASTVSGGVSAGASYNPDRSGGDTAKLDLANNIINMMRNKNQLDKEKAETTLTQFDANNLVTEKFRREWEAIEQKEKAKLTKAQREQLEQQKRNLKAQYNEVMHNIGLSKRWGIRTSDHLNSDVITGWATINEAKAQAEEAKRREEEKDQKSKPYDKYMDESTMNDIRKAHANGMSLDTILDKWGHHIKGKNRKEKAQYLLDNILRGY